MFSMLYAVDGKRTWKCGTTVLCGICQRTSFDCLSFLLCLLLLFFPRLHLQAYCHPSLSHLIGSAHLTPPIQLYWWRSGGCTHPVYAIPLVLKWQAGDRYAILKRGLMNFWHLISCFPVNISLLAGTSRAPPGPLWSTGQKKKQGPLPPLMYSPLM